CRATSFPIFTYSATPVLYTLSLHDALPIFPTASATAVVAAPTPHRRRPPPGERTRPRGRPQASLACSGGPVRPWRSAGGCRRLPAVAQERRTPGRPGSGELAHPAAW